MLDFGIIFLTTIFISINSISQTEVLLVYWYKRDIYIYIYVYVYVYKHISFSLLCIYFLLSQIYNVLYIYLCIYVNAYKQDLEGYMQTCLLGKGSCFNFYILYLWCCFKQQSI
jgi:hypothetical protein